MAKLECYWCGKEYDGGEGYGRFCSKDCFKEWEEEVKSE